MADREEIFVKVAKTGGLTHEVCLNGDRTVKDALDTAGVEYSESNRIRVNGEDVDLDTELEDGDRVIVSSKVKGGN